MNYYLAAGFRLLVALVMLAALVALAVGAEPIERAVDRYSPLQRSWIRSLERPDQRPNKCCGMADGYRAQVVETRPDGLVVEIVEGAALLLPNGAKRSPLTPGTRIFVPKEKINTPSDGNLLGYGFLFVNVSSRGPDGMAPGRPGYVYCYAPSPPNT